MEKTGNTKSATYFGTDAKLQEKYEGLVLGGAIGDALGMPVEGLSREQIQQRFGPKGIQCYMSPPEGTRFYGRLRPGQYTDDTQLMLTTIYGIIRHPIVGLSSQIEELLRIKDTLRGVGKTTWTALNKLAVTGPKNCGVENACGAGVLTRVVPLALLEDNRSDIAYMLLVEDAADLTHKGLVAFGSVFLYSSILSFLLRYKPSRLKIDLSTEEGKRKFIDTHYNLPEGTYTHNKLQADGKNSVYLKKKLEELKTALAMDENEFVRNFGTSGAIWDVLPAALYCFLKSPDKFEEAILRAVNLGGDTDTIGFVTGQMSGAYNGIKGIPPHFSEFIENKDELQKAARDLCSLICSD